MGALKWNGLLIVYTINVIAAIPLVIQGSSDTERSPSSVHNASMFEIDSIDTTFVDSDNQTQYGGLNLEKAGVNLTEAREILEADSNNGVPIVPDAASSGTLSASYLMPLLTKKHYDNHYAPKIFSDLPVTIYTQMRLLSLSDFDYESLRFDTTLELSMQWRDVRLVHNLSKPVAVAAESQGGDTEEEKFLARLWLPDPYFEHAVCGKYDSDDQYCIMKKKVQIGRDGIVKYNVRLQLVISCNMVFCRYPHDKQTCNIDISPYAYSRSSVRLVWSSRPVVLMLEANPPDLTVAGYEAYSRCTVPGAGVTSAQSCLGVRIDMERDSANILIDRYLPAALCYAFAWVAPYVPYDFGEVRIVTPITVLLTLAQLQRGSESLPRVSYMTALDVWYTWMKAAVALALLESLIVIALAKKSAGFKRKLDEDDPRKEIDKQEREYYERKVQKMDKWMNEIDGAARTLPLPIFVVLCVVYYFLFAIGEQKYCL